MTGRGRLLAAAVAGALLCAGCDTASGGEDEALRAAADGTAAAAGGSPFAVPSAPGSPAAGPVPDGTGSSARDLAARFLAAANSGDQDAVAALFAEDARFDSVGRIYDGRDEIMGRFLGPEVIRAGGRYTELSSRQDGDRLVVEYDYDTGYGGSEHFTYAYLVADGLIQDVVGRYV